MSAFCQADLDKLRRDYRNQKIPTEQRNPVKINAANTAAVAQEFFWIPVSEMAPPLGVKLLLINQKHGVAVMGTYSSAHSWTHWQGLPKFKEPNK